MSNAIYWQGIAAEDLTGKEGYAVIVDGSDDEEIALADAATDDTGNQLLGILVKAGASGEKVTVCLSGPCTAVVGGPVEPGDLLTTDGSTGKLHPAATGEHAIARYIPAIQDEDGTLTQRDAADGDSVQVLVGLVYYI